MGENEKEERRGDDPTRWVRAACDVMAVFGVGGGGEEHWNLKQKHDFVCIRNQWVRRRE